MFSRVSIDSAGSVWTCVVRESLAIMRYLCLTFALITAAFSAFASAPSAHTVIGNQAAATYVDATGIQRSVTSNWVQTTVTQVGAFHLSNDNVKVGVAGSVVYISHTLVNQGNGEDSFTIRVNTSASGPQFAAVAVFPDLNGTGVPSSADPLCSTAGVSCATTGFSQSITGRGSFSFLVAYTLRAVALSSPPPRIQAFVTATPTDSSSSHFATYSPNSQTRTDTVTQTNGASFSLTNALQRPAVTGPSPGWPTAISRGEASAPNCPTVWSASLLLENPSCTYTVVTLSYTNMGDAAGALTLRDVIPDGMRYVSGTAIWSNLGGSPLSESAIGDLQGAPANGIHFGWSDTTGQLSATIANVPANASGTLSFVVLIHSSAQAGTSTTSNTTTYFSDSCNPFLSATSGGNCGGADLNSLPSPTLATNTAAFTVIPRIGVVIAREPSIVSDATSPPVKDGLNWVVRPVVSAGGSVRFEHYVTNTGSSADTFNLAVWLEGGLTTFPAGTQWTFTHGDGRSPLADTTHDGIPDTGQILPGQSLKVNVKAQLPAGTETFPAPYAGLIIASSAAAAGEGRAGVIDAIWVEVTAIIGTPVDLTATPVGNVTVSDASGSSVNSSCVSGENCDFGAGPSPLPTVALSGPSQRVLAFPLYIRNNDTQANTFALTAQLPSGWQISFRAGEGQLCDQPPAPDVIQLATGSQAALTACVNPATGSTIGMHLFSLIATSQAPGAQGVVIRDVITYGVRVLPLSVSQMTLSPPTAVIPIVRNTSVLRRVTLRNTGTESCSTSPGGLDASLFLATDAVDAGWTALIYWDRSGTGVLDAQSVLLGPPLAVAPGNLNTAILATNGNPLDLPANGNIDFLIKLTAPASVSNALVDVTLRVADVSSANCPMAHAAYTVHVQSHQVRVHKTQALDAACNADPASLSSLSALPISAAPGQCLIYQVEMTNHGNSALSSVSVNDGVPSFTRYNHAPDGQPLPQCEAHELSGSPLQFSREEIGGVTKAVSCTSAVNSLGPNGYIRMRYSIRVDD